MNCFSARERGAVLLLGIVILTDCAGPMSVREADTRATVRLKQYCAEGKNCGALKLTHNQHFEQGWLVEFDSTASQFAVLVRGDGNTELSIWDKNQSRR